MAHNHPTPHATPPQRCFLSPLTDHHHLLIDLNNSVVFQPIHPTAPSLENLTLLLISRYGCTPASWQIRRVSNAFLARVPEWISQNEFYLDSDFWSIYHFEILPWQTLDGSHQSHPRQRFAITIYDFPLDFCHPSYLRQVTSSMGVLLGYSTNGQTERNLSRIGLLLESLDATFIPPSIHVYHNDRFTVCPITLDGNFAATDQPLLPPFPPHDMGNWSNHEPTINQPPNTPYLPPWRRRIMRLPIPQRVRIP